MFANRTIGGVTIPCVAIYIVVVLAIFAYGYVLRRTRSKDVLAVQFYDHPICQEIDGWSVSHFVLFGILGVLYPGHHLQFFAIGYFWEIVETVLGQNKIDVTGKGRRLQLIGDQEADGTTTGNDDKFWYGKMSDVVMDFAGYAVGSAFAETYWPNKR